MPARVRSDARRAGLGYSTRQRAVQPSQLSRASRRDARLVAKPLKGTPEEGVRPCGSGPPSAQTQIFRSLSLQYSAHVWSKQLRDGYRPIAATWASEAQLLRVRVDVLYAQCQQLPTGQPQD